MTRRKRKRKSPQDSRVDSLTQDFISTVGEVQTLFLDEKQGIGMLQRLAELFDQDPLLRDLMFPLGRTMEVLIEYLEEHGAFKDESEPSGIVMSDPCQQFVISRVLDEDVRDAVAQAIRERFAKRTSRRDRRALALGFCLIDMEGWNPEAGTPPIWTFIYLNTLQRIVAEIHKAWESSERKPEGASVLTKEVRLAEEQAARGGEDGLPDDKDLTNVYHGIDHGYLDRFLPFYYLIRLPFAVRVLIGEDEGGSGKAKSPNEENRRLAEIMRTASQEGGMTGVVEKMLEVYRGRAEEAGNARSSLFYNSLVHVLENYEPEENPALPSLYYAHYVHYLSAGEEEESREIRSLLDDPTNPDGYESYAAVLEAEGEAEAAARVREVRDEVIEWSDRMNKE